MASKLINTRNMLIDVARDLFAKYGKKNVTMHDIAEASQKGRRTLYTYFKSKEEIYKAVIQKELDYVLDEVTLVCRKQDEPDMMLRNLILTHLQAVKVAVHRNGSLSADFFRDIYEVERQRRRVDLLEIKMIKTIIIDGIERGIFKRIDPELSAVIIFYSIKGLEIPFIRQSFKSEFENNRNSVIEFVFSGIKRR